MKTRPILFSAPMIRAILAGHKTQTRRIYKEEFPLSYGFLGIDQDTNRALFSGPSFHTGLRCPYGTIGDRLWVRETWQEVTGPSRDDDPAEFQASRKGITYSADWEEKAPFPWKPSVFMPRWASRITLEITDIRVQRLQAISEIDARAEGISTSITSPSPTGIPGLNAKNYVHARDYFADLWNHIHGDSQWERNPFVWAITFKPLITDH
jgi:hypothetical protein